MSILRLALFALAIFALPLSATAGTLDDAPFRVVLPEDQWTVKEMPIPEKSLFGGQCMFTNKDGTLLVLIIKLPLLPNASYLDDVLNGARKRGEERKAKIIDVGDTTFLELPAKKFHFQAGEDGKFLYHEMVIFKDAKNAWMIDFAGQPTLKDQFPKLREAIQKKPANDAPAPAAK